VEGEASLGVGATQGDGGAAIGRGEPHGGGDDGLAGGEAGGEPQLIRCGGGARLQTTGGMGVDRDGLEVRLDRVGAGGGRAEGGGEGDGARYELAMK
jgi:hypothetical protein